MKPLSTRARLILDRYKAFDSLGSDSKKRLLDVILQRGARGDLLLFGPGLHVDCPVHASAKTMPEHTCGNALVMASDSACIAAAHTQ